MAELMGDPRDPDAHDGAPTAVDDAPALVLETAPVDTSVAAGGDAAAAREAEAHYVKGKAHGVRPQTDGLPDLPRARRARPAHLPSLEPAIDKGANA